MNIIWIFIKELLQLYRNLKAVIQLTLLPIILIMVLGFALSGEFYNSKDFSRVNILYYNLDNGMLSEEFKSFILQMEKKGFEFDAAKDLEEGYKSIKNKEFSCFIIIENESPKVELYKNERDTIKADIAEALLTSFMQRYNIMYDIEKGGPELANQIRELEDRSYVTGIGAERKKLPRSIDYYAVTMVTLFVMYSCLIGVKSVSNEQIEHTDIRLACSAVKRREILIGKILGSFTFTMLQITFLIMFSKYVLKAYWGNNMGVILIIVISEILAVQSIGIGLAYMYGKKASIVPFLNKLVPILIFLGGGYFPIDFNNRIFDAISNLSPVKWVNKAIFQVIYSNDAGMAIFIIILNIIIALTFISISGILSKKEAV